LADWKPTLQLAQDDTLSWVACVWGCRTKCAGLQTAKVDATANAKAKVKAQHQPPGNANTKGTGKVKAKVKAKATGDADATQLPVLLRAVCRGGRGHALAR